MNKEKIIDDDLIAKFMGYRYRNQSKYWVTYSLDDNSFLSKLGYVHKLEFSSSWDWIIPVIKKCIKSGINQSDYVNQLHDGLLTCDLNMCYSAVIEFIKYHNSCQK